MVDKVDFDKHITNGPGLEDGYHERVIESLSDDYFDAAEEVDTHFIDGERLDLFIQILERNDVSVKKAAEAVEQFFTIELIQLLK